MPSPALLPLVLALGAPAAAPATAPPIACRPHALDKVQRKRQQELLELMHRSALERQELPDGFGFRLAPALFQQAAEWISLERRCCPFVRFELAWKEDDSVWVRLGGGPGVKEAISEEMGFAAR
jgi:hypothetical protein